MTSYSKLFEEQFSIHNAEKCVSIETKTIETIPDYQVTRSGSFMATLTYCSLGKKMNDLHTAHITCLMALYIHL